jgi:ABC-type sugar transport system substrate-binding protein
VAACALAACSSSATGGATAGTTAAHAAGSLAAGSRSAALAYSAAVDPAYDGTDEGNFNTLADPPGKPGTAFKVGFLSTNAGQPILLAMQKAAQAEVEKLGGTFIALDAASDPQKQASQPAQPADQPARQRHHR